MSMATFSRSLGYEQLKLIKELQASQNWEFQPLILVKIFISIKPECKLSVLNTK
jgi:hypothetical protein